MIMKTFAMVLGALVLLGGGWYLYSMQAAPATTVNVNTPPVTTTPTPMPPIVTPPVATSTPATGAVKEFTVTNAGMTFTTKTLAIKKGDRVKITFKNAGGTHDMRIDSYNVGTKVIQAGQQETFEFVADKAGSFEYFCSVGNHRAMGMVGRLTVSE